MKFLSKLYTAKETIITIIIGIASLLIAYSTFSGALWNSSSAENYAKGTAMTVEANTTYIAALLNWDESTQEERERELGAFDEEITQAEEKTKAADIGNKNSDLYQFFTVLFGAVAFFTSLAGTTKNQRLVITILVISILTVLTLSSFLASLPKPSFSF